MSANHVKARLLVVEDDLNLLEGIRDILELEDYAVLTAENGQDGLGVLNNETAPPDLIVSDIMMPHMDGIRFLQEVRKQKRWVTIPFIFLTAKGEKADIQRGKQLGVDDYVVKPFDTKDLLVAIESRLKRQQALNEVHMSAVEHLKRNILTILNHEFRTPLTFVVAYADMLNSHEAGDLSNSEMLTFLKGVSSGAERLRRLIENFILLVEIETEDAARTYSWRKQPVYNLQELLQAAVDRACAGQKIQHQFHLDIQGNVPQFIADVEYLVTALTHLVDNAVKFSEENTLVIVGAKVENAELRIWVEDQGRGIPEAEMEHIWDSFYQVNREYYEDPGTGSGLAIARGIAQIHGGRMEVKSQVNCGSVFTVVIPI